jgi:PIN domain nuclease of toxin-antitoxin system
MKSREVSGRYAWLVLAAELPPLHRDPFDRILIAQAQSEQLTLVTADEAFVATACR